MNWRVKTRENNLPLKVFKSACFRYFFFLASTAILAKNAIAARMTITPSAIQNWFLYCSSAPPTHARMNARGSVPMKVIAVNFLKSYFNTPLVIEKTLNGTNGRSEERRVGKEG